MAKTLVHFNFKGGVGKTSISTLSSYLLAERKKKTLLIDLDPQSNATEIVKETFKNLPDPKTSFYEGLLKLDLSDSIVSATDYLDVIPADWSLSLWSSKVESYKERDRNLILKNLIARFKQDYDYIIIDVPPTLSVFTNNAILACDYISLILQTQRQAYTSVLKTAEYLNQLRDDYSASFKLVGVILYLVKKNARVDKIISETAKDSFGEAVFANTIQTRERVKAFSNDGIKNKDMWDKQVLKMYGFVLNEELTRIKELGD